MKINYKIIKLPLFVIAILWIIFWFENRFDIPLSTFGIYPREVSNLMGIIYSPFLHGDIQHLYNNTTALFILLLLMQYFYKQNTFKVLIFSAIFSGLFTWIFGRSSYHIGASGIIYGLVSFIFFKGILTKNYKLIAISFLIVFLYGGLLWFMFPEIDNKISWEGHLGGFLSGIIMAILTKTPEEYKTNYKYDWENPEFNRYQDPFMKHFDEQGNFVKKPHQHTTSKYEINYMYKKNDE